MPLIFRPAGSQTWLLGSEDAARPYHYPHGQDAFLVAHAAFSHRSKPVDLIDIFPRLNGAARSIGNKLRNARGRLVRWIASRTACTPLAAAVHAIEISNDGYVRYDPDCRAPQILTT